MKKMRMELKIALTFAIMFVAGVIINGLYSLISLGEGFFTFRVMANSMLSALIYLGYIWLYSRRHKLLAMLGALGIALLLLFAELSSSGVAATVGVWSWRNTVMLIYYIIASIIAANQA